MFVIEISRTWYLFSGPVYVFVSVIVSVTMTWYLRRSVTMIWSLSWKLNPIKYKMVSGGWHEVYIRLHQQYQY